MKPAKIEQLRNKIAKAVPQDRLILKPGEFHVYHDPLTGVDFKSTTTKLKVISNPIFAGWRMNRALEKYDELIPQIIAGKITQEEAVKIAKAYPEEVFKIAGERGTATHGYIDLFLSDWIKTGKKPDRPIISYLDGSNGQPEEKDFAIWSAVQCAEDWINESGFIPLASEIRVWSTKFQEAGTLDGIGIIGDDIVLIDWKTSNELRDDYHLQVGCYYRCFAELTLIQPKYGVIIKLDKQQAKLDPPEIVKDLPLMFEYYQVFSKGYDIMQEIREGRDEARNKSKKIVTI